MDLADLEKRYRAYVDAYRGADGRLPLMMELKLVHTFKVAENSREIARGEGFSPHETELALAAAILHDAGRYEQLKKYGTFRDSDSVDHAAFSRKVAEEQGWTAAWAPEDRRTVLEAVLHHNKRDVPPDLSPAEAKIAHSVRDADKLDIFRVTEERAADGDWRNGASTAFWGLAPAERPSPEIVAAILESRPADYRHVRSLPDFVILQAGWMSSGLHFATSRRLCARRGHLEFRERFLREITGPSGRADVDAVCAKAAEALAAAEREAR